jgi:hypothetical protein
MTDNKGLQKKPSSQAAIIGLVGTILTVCGGITGALLGGITTIYKIEQKVQNLSIAAPQSNQPLAIDTHQITISSAEVTKLDPSKYLAFPDLGFVIAQPPIGWRQGGQMTYYDLFMEQEENNQGINLSPLIMFYSWIKEAWDDQPVRQMRYTDPVIVQYLEGSTENDVAVDLALLEHDTVAFYNQITILLIFE